ncbi:MAG: SRPBCC domain-containing protein [Candidatus Rokubacteria bacterium]|nr:SRPBCC domain-containing protein [Candidatus Rokubacteria bacterium]
MTAPAIRLVRILPAPPDDVFAAWTDRDSIREWMCPGSIRESLAELDVRVGGRFTIVMRGPNGEYRHTGEYLEVDRPHRLVFTWLSPGTRGRVTRVTVALKPVGTDATELTLIHEDIPDDTSFTEHQRGWGDIVAKLDARLRQIP